MRTSLRRVVVVPGKGNNDVRACASAAMSLSSCSSRRLSSSKICVEDSLPLMEVPPTANPLALHKVTLRFEDREVEREVCSKYTQSTYVMNMSVLGFLFVQHIVISIWKPARALSHARTAWHPAH